MSISNPVTINYNSEAFTYEGGDTLYHFSPHDNGWSDTMECNIVFFANSEEHAIDVLKRMFQYCVDEYKKKEKSDHNYVRHYDDVREKWYKEMLYNIKNKETKVIKAPTDQVYKVGWASNDNLR